MNGIAALGFEATVERDRDLDWISEQRVSDEPVIVSQRFARGAHMVRHAVVVEGLDDQAILYVDPATGRGESLPFGEFLYRWEVAGGTALLLHLP